MLSTFFAIFKQRIQQASSAIMHDANIVHAVKNRYKQKSILEFTRVGFIGFEGGGSTVFNQQSPFCMAEGVVLHGKRTTFDMQRRLNYNEKGALLLRKGLLLCLLKLHIRTHTARNALCHNDIMLHAQNSRISG